MRASYLVAILLSLPFFLLVRKARRLAEAPTTPDLLEAEKEVLTAFKDQFHFARDRLRSIDAKAQGTIAIAGIFLAAIFALTRNGTRLGVTHQVLILGALILLVASVLLAVLTLKVRKFTAPPAAEVVRRLLDRAIKADSRAPSALVGTYNDQAHLWSAANRSAYETAEQKATLLEAAQWVLLLAVGLVAVSTAVTIFNG